jgi:hypothetical protein
MGSGAGMETASDDSQTLAKAQEMALGSVGLGGSGEGRNRTGDTTVFSRVLYQLSYLAKRHPV